jgi:hypothetical protein
MKHFWSEDCQHGIHVRIVLRQSKCGRNNGMRPLSQTQGEEQTPCSMVSLCELESCRPLQRRLQNSTGSSTFVLFTDSWCDGLYYGRSQNVGKLGSLNQN